MAVILARVQVRKNKLNEFQKIMFAVEKKVKKEEGCEHFQIYQDVQNETTFSFCGIWKTSDAFKKHLQSDEFSMMLVALKLLRRNPEIRYCERQLGLGLYGLLQLRESIE